MFKPQNKDRKRDSNMCEITTVRETHSPKLDVDHRKLYAGCPLTEIPTEVLPNAKLDF